MKFLLFCLGTILFSIQAISAQSESEILYTVPLYQHKDPSGKFVAQIIDVELSKIAMKNKLGRLKKIDFAADTAIRRYYQQDSLNRDSQGFINTATVKKLLQKLNVSSTKILLIYDVTARQDFINWKPSVIVTPGGGLAGAIILDNLFANADLSEFDSLWCKLSLIDFEKPAQSLNISINANEETCSGEPVDCIVETIQKVGNNAASPKERTELKLIEAPTEQHWGKIVGGSILLAGGFGLLTISKIIDRDARGLTRIGGAGILCGGATLLTVGIIKQSKYSR